MAWPEGGLQGFDGEGAVNERLGGEQPRLARTRVVALASEEVEGGGGPARRVEVAGLADVAADAKACRVVAALDHLARRAPVCGEEDCRADAERRGDRKSTRM